MARDLKTEALFTEKLAALEARVAKLEADLSERNRSLAAAVEGVSIGFAKMTPVESFLQALRQGAEAEALRQPESPPPLTAEAFDALLEGSAVFRDLSDSYQTAVATMQSDLSVLSWRFEQLSSANP